MAGLGRNPGPNLRPERIFRRRRAAWLALGILLALGPLVPPSAAGAEVLELTPDEALMTARATYLSGDVAAANHIGRVLAEITPDDPRVHLLLSATEAKLGRPSVGLSYGRKAWTLSRQAHSPKALRYEIARNTALSALAAGRPMLAQLWLRRSLDVAPDEAAQEASGRDIAFVRDRTPWRLSFEMEAGPSDNLNGGAESSVFSIGDFVLGDLSNGAQALSGEKASLRLGFERALPGTDRAQTVLRFSGETVRNHIGAASLGLAGSVTSRDLDRSRLAFGLRRDMLVGTSDLPLSLSVEIGHNWAGGEPLGPSLGLEAQGAIWRGAQGTLQLSGSVERSWTPGEPDGSDVFNLAVIGDRALAAGKGRISLALALEGARSASANATYDATRLSLQVYPDWHLGGMAVSFGATVGLRDYDEFLLIGNSVAVTGGRQDKSFGLSATLSLDDLSVMGFAPVLSVHHGQTRSNVSRYETSTTGIGIGITSSF